MGTMDYILCYQASDLCLVGYSDADWGGDLDQRKSTFGYAFLLSNGAMSWSRKKQSCIGLSTMESEYVACLAVVQEGVWLRSSSQGLALSHKLQSPSPCIVTTWLP